MSTSAKIRFEGQFYKPGTLELTSLASLDAFVREFLRTRGVATAATSKLALLFRDAAGEWQALHDESDLVAALHDESKITIDVVVLPDEEQGTNDNSDDNNDVVEEDDKTTTEETTNATATAAAAAVETPAVSLDEQQRKQLCRAACRKRGKRCAVFWLIILGILLFCGFGGGCRHKREQQQQAVANSVAPIVRFMHVPPSFPQADLARLHELAVQHVNEQLGRGAMSPADRAEFTFLGQAAEKMFEDNERMGNVARQLEHDVRVLQQQLVKAHADDQHHAQELNRCVAVHNQLREHTQTIQQALVKERADAQAIQQELFGTRNAAESQAHEFQRCVAVNEQLRAQLAHAVQHASTATPPDATPDRDSLSHLFLDVSRKLGQLATSQMDELAQKHLGKPLDELLDGSAVRKSLFETLKAFNEKLDSQQKPFEIQRQQQREQERQRQAEEERIRQQRQQQLLAEEEQERERQTQQLHQQQQREHQRLVQQHQQRLREQQQAEKERVERLHRQHQREIRRHQEEHESAAKSIAKDLRDRAKAAKREMRRHNEL